MHAGNQCSPSQSIQRTRRRMCSHIPLKERTQIRKVMLQKRRDKKRKHSVHPYFRKNKKEMNSASRKVSWLDNSRAQSPQRRTWISEQSPIRCRGTSSRHSMDTILSVQEQHFTGDEEEFTKVPIAVTEAKSYSYVQFVRIWQVLWRNIMESSNNYTLIRDTQNCRTRCKSSKRRDISAVLLQSGSDDKW